MSYYTQKPAENGKVMALALQETLFVAAWGTLTGALFLPVTHLWGYTILPAVLISIHFLVSMELTGDGSPLVSLEIKQHTANGEKTVSRWAVYFRILLTVVLFPTALIGYIPLLFGKTSLPELITGTRLTATNRRLDPRHPAVINGIIKKAKIRIRTLTLVPLAAAAAAFILLHSAPVVMSLQTAHMQEGLLEHEQELLTHYLELTALHPEELEYHVRLASLYHRNNMQQDLMNELTIIAEIDSTHAILILADSTTFSFEMLEPLPEDSSADLTATMLAETVTEIQTDSTAADSTASDSPGIQADSTASDSPGVQADSTELITGTDSLDNLSSDSVLIFPDTLPEALPDTLHALSQVEEEETDIPEEITTPTTDEIQETEEEIVEPDTLVHP